MNWQRLVFSPASPHESSKLELPRAWEPSDSKDLCQLVKEKKPNMDFLMETKLRSASFDSIKAKLGFSCVFVVDSKGRSGGLALSGKNITT
jgi:hypothetical protein